MDFFYQTRDFNMSKLRSLSTAFWSDPFIEELSPSEKLLFIYLITNEKTNMLGIYESSIKKISFETGIPSNTISEALKKFEASGKVKYANNYVILVNFMKHQNFNPNMMKSAIDTYNSLPNELKDNSIVVDKSNPSKGFETLLNHFGMVRKIEVEDELEDEKENESEREAEYSILSSSDLNLLILKNSSDYLAIKTIWNKFAEKFAKPKIEFIEENRKTKLKTRFAEKNFDIFKILTKATEQGFLLEKTFFTFDWMVDSKSNYTKVLEGNYTSSKEKFAPKESKAEERNRRNMEIIKRNEEFIQAKKLNELNNGTNTPIGEGSHVE